MTRPFRPYLPLVLLTSLLIGLAGAYLWLHLVMPFDNGRLQPGTNAITAEGVIVTPVRAQSGSLQAGDIVVAVNGRSLEEWLTATAPMGQNGDILNYTVIRQGEVREAAVTLSPYPAGQIITQEWGTITFRLLYLLIAGYVFLRRPGEQAARLLLLTAAAQFSSGTWSLGAQVSDFMGGTGIWLYHITTIVAFILSWIAAFHFALVFPQPLSFMLKRRWFMPLVYVVPYLLLIAYFALIRGRAVNILGWMSYWGPPTGLYAAVFLSLTLVTIVWQYRRHRTGIRRQQMRWLGFAALVVGGSAVLFYFLPPFLGAPGLNANGIGLIGILFPLALAVAILRHNLFDIETLLNRTLVYGGLTAVIITLYILSVSLLSALFQTQGNLFIALITTGLVAVIFQPLRERLQRAVNRLMYGERDEPFEVLVQLGQRLEQTLTADKVYPVIVETVAQTLKLPYTAVTIQRNGQFQTAESYGKPTSNLATYPLTHQGEIVGQLLVARRATDETFSEADERILRNIARQAGTAVHAVQLMADLQRSRQQIVSSREEERRRLRRDLHDGIGPALAALHLQAAVLRHLIRDDPETAETLVDEFKADIRNAIEEIRRVVYALRPPVLDELGLVAAIRACAAQYSRGQHNLQVQVESPAEMPALPAAVEVAAYRIVQEALANVAHHAQARHCHICLEMSHGLSLEIVDDGVGLADGKRGLGLLSMQERAAELGGRCKVSAAVPYGTRVTAHLPLPEEVGNHE